MSQAELDSLLKRALEVKGDIDRRRKLESVPTLEENPAHDKWDSENSSSREYPSESQETSAQYIFVVNTASEKYAANNFIHRAKDRCNNCIERDSQNIICRNSVNLKGDYDDISPHTVRVRNVRVRMNVSLHPLNKIEDMSRSHRGNGEVYGIILVVSSIDYESVKQLDNAYKYIKEQFHKPTVVCVYCLESADDALSRRCISDEKLTYLEDFAKKNPDRKFSVYYSYPLHDHSERAYNEAIHVAKRMTSFNFDLRCAELKRKESQLKETKSPSLISPSSSSSSNNQVAVFSKYQSSCRRGCAYSWILLKNLLICIGGLFLLHSMYSKFYASS